MFGLLGSYAMFMRSNKAENLTDTVIALNRLAFCSEVLPFLFILYEVWYSKEKLKSLPKDGTFDKFLHDQNS